MPAHATVPNHHADHPGFSGVSGQLLAIAMAVGRGRVARLAADVAGVTGTDRVIDVGCGPGKAARLAARRGARVIGVDPARVMLRVARAIPAKRITWLDGVAESLPVPAGSATVVWSLATVHHWTDVGQGLAQTHRALVPGGRFVAIERRTEPGATGLASHGWTPEQADAFAAECRAAGFADVEVAAHEAGRRVVLVVRAVRP